MKQIFKFKNYDSTSSEWIENQVSWLNDSENNTFLNPEKLLDNDTTTSAGLSMKAWNQVYTKELFIDFGENKSIDGFKFFYLFPNASDGAVSKYPGSIAYTCKGNLFLKDESGDWAKAFECPNLNAYDEMKSPIMSDSAEFHFPPKKAREWKFEITGNFWLGGQFQSITFYMVQGIAFREFNGSFTTEEKSMKDEKFSPLIDDLEKGFKDFWHKIKSGTDDFLSEAP
jgi:hypothetical protein